MAEVNLAPGEYGEIIIQLPTTVTADTPAQVLLATGAGEAGFIPGMYATNGNIGTWRISVWVEKSSVIISYISENEPIKGGGKLGNKVNLLQGVPYLVPESCTVYAYAVGYDGTDPASGCKVNCSWAKILPPA